MHDDTMRSTLTTALARELDLLVDWLGSSPDLDLATAERTVRERVSAIGGRLLEAGLVARGTGKAGPRLACPCGGQAPFEGYRSKTVQTLVGEITLRRAYYACARCGQGQVPLDAALQLASDRPSPGVRRLVCQFGALLPFAQAARLLAEASGLVVPASTVRSLTERWGQHCEEQLRAASAQGWTSGWPLATGPAPARLYVAMDGVQILDTTGAGKEAKVGVMVPEVRRPDGQVVRLSASYAASFEEAAAFGRRLAAEAHRRGLEQAADVVVLGDGASWIWNLALEHCPTATQIVDWYHASEHVWALGRALYGADSPPTVAWVKAQLDLLWDGKVAELLEDWPKLPCHGEVAAVRDAEVTYFTNQAGRMAYDQYRAWGMDIGSGMVESACKYVIGAREKGPGMRWSVPGAQAVATVRVLVFNARWDDIWAAAPAAA